MDKHLLDILCCPLTKEPLRPMRRDELDALNRTIDAGDVVSVSGTSVSRKMMSALITRDKQRIYRVDDDIPILLVDEGIKTGQVTGFPN